MTELLDQIRSSSTLSRFWKKVRISENECWEWLGGTNSFGYGIFWTGKRKKVAHRFLYEILVGKVPSGFDLDHLCRNPRCVNPAHLEAVSHQENCQRGEAGIKTGLMNKAKTHCPKGHPYDEENTYTFPDGRRACRTCFRNRYKENDISMNRLKEFRIKKGLSQSQLTILTSIKPPDISRIENRKIPPFPNWRKRLAEALGITEDELFPQLREKVKV